MVSSIIEMRVEMAIMLDALEEILTTKLCSVMKLYMGMVLVFWEIIMNEF